MLLVLRRIYELSLRECKIFMRNPIYVFCMVVFPLAVMVFFTSMLENGQPQEMPIGVVDPDNSSTTRALIRRLDAFQTSQVVANYPSVSAARRAIQNNEIYGFIYFPEGTTERLLSGRQPKISFYYSMTSVTAGSLVFRDLKTVATLGSAAVGQATMRARIGNPTTDYNAFLSTMMVPGIMMLFIFLITTYAIGTELKFNYGKQIMVMGGNRIWVTLVGKLLPHLMIWLTLTFCYSFYVFGILEFPHPGGTGMIVLLNLLM